jgi:hypothetical protein
LQVFVLFLSSRRDLRFAFACNAQLKNKSQKVGAFLAAKICGAKTPHPPHIPPHAATQKTTSRRRGFLKYPCKTSHPPQAETPENYLCL